MGRKGKEQLNETMRTQIKHNGRKRSYIIVDTYVHTDTVLNNKLLQLIDRKLAR